MLRNPTPVELIPICGPHTLGALEPGPCRGVNILMLSALNKSNLGSQLLYLNISSRSEPGLGLGLGLHMARDNINLETRRADMWRYVDHFIISGFWIICCDTNNPVNVLTVPPLHPPACSPCQDHLFTDYYKLHHSLQTINYNN